MLKKERPQTRAGVGVSEPDAPRTTPECKQLENMVIAGLKSNVFDADKKQAARAALKRFRKNRCVKSLEYIMQVTSTRNIFNNFAEEILDTATKYLNELSQYEKNTVREKERSHGIARATVFHLVLIFYGLFCLVCPTIHASVHFDEQLLSCTFRVLPHASALAR